MPITCLGRKMLFVRQELENWVESGCPPRARWIEMNGEKAKQMAQGERVRS